MRIGIVAPPWITVPPTIYGGTEVVVDNLARGLSARGHEVRLFTVGESTCPVPKAACFNDVVTPMGLMLPEAVHVLAAYQELRDVDIIHDHTLLGPLLALGRVRAGTPVVITNHGAVTPMTSPVLREATRHAALVAISRDQQKSAPHLPVTAVIHHGIDLEQYSFGPGGGGYLLFMGRMSPDKGPHRAIRVARATGYRIVVISKMWEDGEHEYYESVVRPLLGPDVDLILNSTPAERIKLLQHAEAVLNPITWREPFGLVMAEAMACGTPVLGYPSGAAPEIIEHGRSGFLETSEEGLIEAVGRLGELDRRECREVAERRFSMDRMVRDHERLYRSLLRTGRSTVLAPRPTVRRPAGSRDLALRRTVGVDG